MYIYLLAIVLSLLIPAHKYTHTHTEFEGTHSETTQDNVAKTAFYYDLFLLRAKNMFILKHRSTRKTIAIRSAATRYIKVKESVSVCLCVPQDLANR